MSDSDWIESPFGRGKCSTDPLNQFVVSGHAPICPKAARFTVTNSCGELKNLIIPPNL
jgi:hypothetical protein